MQQRQRMEKLRVAVDHLASGPCRFDESDLARLKGFAEELRSFVRGRRPKPSGEGAAVYHMADYRRDLAHAS